jgi:membrane-associated phospholipid phosphatase
MSMAKQDRLHGAKLIPQPNASTPAELNAEESGDAYVRYPAKTAPRRIESAFDLRARGWLAGHPVVGLLLIAFGAAVLGVLGYQLRTNGPMVQWDVQLAAQLHSMALKTPAPILEDMTFGFFLGKQDLQLLGAVLVVYFLYKRYWPELAMVVIGWMGGSLIWSWIIQYFNRPRPAEQVGIPVHSIPSFPSGHTMFAALALGLLAYLLVPTMPSLFWKWAAALAAILTMLFIGFSRLLEGGHYLSDVIAGYALGIAWGALVYTLLEGFVVRRRDEP